MRIRALTLHISPAHPSKHSRVKNFLPENSFCPNRSPVISVKHSPPKIPLPEQSPCDKFPSLENSPPRTKSKTFPRYFPFSEFSTDIPARQFSQMPAELHSPSAVCFEMHFEGLFSLKQTESSVMNVLQLCNIVRFITAEVSERFSVNLT